MRETDFEIFKDFWQNSFHRDFWLFEHEEERLNLETFFRCEKSNLSHTSSGKNTEKSLVRCVAFVV